MVSLAVGRTDRPEETGLNSLVSSPRLAMLLFLAAEVMFFAGLVGAFLVFRMGSISWPPVGQPRLPVEWTLLNTVILLISSVAMWRANQSSQKSHGPETSVWLGATLFLGGVFLAVQGFEWVRLLEFGLTVSSGPFGFTFYTLVGCHAAHVTAGLVWLAVTFVREAASLRGYGSRPDLDLCRMFWYFVVAL